MGRPAGSIPTLLTLCALWTASGSCTSSKSRPTKSRDDASVKPSQDCESLRPHLRSLYQKAASDESIAHNLRADYLRANLHMVLQDCLREPASVLPCARQATNVGELEMGCLIALDDKGKAEEREFAP